MMLQTVEQTGKELEEFVRQLFYWFVDTATLHSDRDRRLAASGIAAAVIDSHIPAVHLAYTAVRAERVAAGQIIGAM